MLSFRPDFYCTLVAGRQAFFLLKFSELVVFIRREKNRCDAPAGW
ncbi:hypothetical protein DAQ1742_04212 [Dickeya aquatica]|uniref:Uncharacterized protein n=1 Tax=Dickeya aquatica TaxID=1401087 RepID=A0A375AFY3_9GAMM|nr:hypothetical protein DAQ1742_04212 [Dickeya aquatica]